MKNISTGTGLCVLGLCALAYPVVDRLVPAAAAAHAAPVTLAKAMGPVEPTVVWMGATQTSEYSYTLYHRMWSDGRIEWRANRVVGSGGCFLTNFCSTDWIEVPPPPAGNGFACRTDLNGDRAVDGADLGMLLSAWGDHVSCPPEATYPCLGFANGGLIR